MEAIDEEIKNEPPINKIPETVVQYQLNSSIQIEERKEEPSLQERSEENPDDSIRSIEIQPLPIVAHDYVPGDEEPNIQPDVGAYYDYYQRERLENERRFFLNLAIFRGVYEIIYLSPVIILYLVNQGKDCGASMNVVILIEILLRLCLFNLIRIPLLTFGRNSRYLMGTYRIFAILKFFGMFLWNITFIVLFSVSTNRCIDKAAVLWVSTLLVFLQSIIEFLLRVSFFLLLIVAIIAHRADPELRELREMRMDRKLIIKIVSKIKNLKLSDNELNKGEDNCCICLENFENDSIAIFLPCNKKHIFHYPCISEWLSTQARCPICKEILSMKAIEGAIKTMKNK
ncbi:unnamed protein product [Moneuplotes crassus]|uniref:RING-type domain-containing protein n=1 Tax=Euplotes crassus TaxID=5936 RepID=A0AAD1XLL7_EUPCR|nr:unnamed protein product [Moneuplotes crassus]